MIKPLFTKKLAMAGCALLAAAGVGRAQLACTGTDTGSTTITPGTYDISQLLCSTQTGKPGNLNWYWDNGNPNGSTFTTGSNPGGYVLNSLAIKTIGGGGSDGAGNEFYVQPYAAYIYSVSGTTATLVAYYLSAPFGLQTQGDWVQLTGLNTALAPNTTYAYTFSRTQGGYECLGFTNGIPGGMCEIPTGGGTINYGNGGASTYSATYDLGLALPTAFTVNPPVASPGTSVSLGMPVTLTAGTAVDTVGNGTYTYQWQTDGGSGTITNIPGATSSTLSVPNVILGHIQYDVIVTDSTSASITSATTVLSVTDVMPGTYTDLQISNNLPVGFFDLYNVGSYYNGATPNQGGLNYYSNAGPPVGEVFTTGANTQGYILSAISVLLGGNNPPYNFGGGFLGTTIPVAIDIYSVNGTTATLLYQVTNTIIGDWPTYYKCSLSTNIILQPNTTYGYTFGSTGGGTYAIMSSVNSSSETLSDTNGSASGILNGGASISPSTGAVVYGSGIDGTFDLSLVPVGLSAPVAGTPVANPNPAYALSPVVLTGTASGVVGSGFQYQWLTDDGSGATPPHYQVIPGSTLGAGNTNFTVHPLDIGGGSPYTTNYYLKVFNGSSSATSSPAILTVLPASAPLFTALPNTNLFVFAGQASLSFTFTENGTHPITNQWYFDNGSGGVTYTPLSGQANTTLTLTNLLVSQSGNYEFGATNQFGSTNGYVAVTVLPDPSIVPSQKFSYQVLTNHPWVFYRLNETNDPTAVGAPKFPAYDSSGNGFNATYGNLVTVNNAGPQAPAWPGLETTNLAAGTVSGSFQGVVSVPNLNLTGNSNVTFMAWINPNSGQAGSTGLFFNRGGPDSAAGFGFANNGTDLGYTWDNNSATTYNYDSGLAPIVGLWNFVAWVVTPTNTTIYLANVNGGVTNFSSAVQIINNTAETFNGGAIELGGDQNSAGRQFNGLISDAALFTNALTQAQVVSYFATALGVSALPPSLQDTLGLPSANVISGQNVRLHGDFGGTPPLTLQWQTSPDASTWLNVPGGTTNDLLINPITVGTIYYQLIVRNSAGSVTSSAPLAVTFSAPPTAPAALWTINFQSTNNIADGNQDEGNGPGQYVGRGALGTGTYWNVLPAILPPGAPYNAPSPTNVTDFLDDGATHSGIICQFNGVGQYDAVGTSLFARTDIGTLLDQWSRSYTSVNAIQVTSLPPGTYNVICYGGNGYNYQGSDNVSTKFVVHDALNGDQTQTTACPAPQTALQQGVNFVVFTGVHSSGALNLDAPENINNGSPQDGAGFEGLQLQLVSYDPPSAAFTGTPTNAFVGQSVAFSNTSAGYVTNSVWSFGDGTSVTNTSTAGVSHTYATAGAYTVSLTVSGPGGAPSSVSHSSFISVYPVLQISNASLNAGHLILSGLNGAPGDPYRVLSATNLTQPLATWTTVFSGFFGANGSYNFTNSGTTNSASFYRLVTP